MDSQLRTDDADAQQRVNDFYRFIDAEEAEDRVQFTIKAGMILTHCAPQCLTAGWLACSQLYPVHCEFARSMLCMKHACQLK